MKTGYRRSNPVGSGAIAWVAAVLLLVPQFACRCADGRTKPFCLPAQCDTLGCAASPHRSSSCCAHEALDSRNRAGGCHRGPTPDSADAIGGAPCCQLVFQGQTPPTSVSQIDLTLSSVALPALDEPHGKSSNQPCQIARLAAIDHAPPPDDLVITQSCLTI